MAESKGAGGRGLGYRRPEIGGDREKVKRVKRGRRKWVFGCFMREKIMKREGGVLA